MSADLTNLPPAYVDDSPGDAPDDTPVAATDAERQKAEWLSQPAPYGRFKSGKPRKTPPKSGSRRTTSTRTKKTTSYEEGINGLFQMAAFTCAMGGAKSKALMADSLAITEHGPAIASALDVLAQERPEVAAVLDRVLAVGPYGLVLGAVAPLALQIIGNHGLVKLPGVASADEYLASAEETFANAA